VLGGVSPSSLRLLSDRNMCCSYSDARAIADGWREEKQKALEGEIKDLNPLQS
jgi:hypothetical protein